LEKEEKKKYSNSKEKGGGWLGKVEEGGKYERVQGLE